MTIQRLDIIIDSLKDLEINNYDELKKQFMFKIENKLEIYGTENEFYVIFINQHISYRACIHTIEEYSRFSISCASLYILKRILNNENNIITSYNIANQKVNGDIFYGTVNFSLKKVEFKDIIKITKYISI
jgi:hypothetical protein